MPDLELVSEAATTACDISMKKRLQPDELQSLSDKRGSNPRKNETTFLFSLLLSINLLNVKNLYYLTFFVVISL